MPTTHSALVLAERHIEAPVQRVFNTPMIANRLCKWLGAAAKTADVIAHVARFAVAHLSRANRHADGLQFLPRFASGQLLRHGELIVHAPILPAVRSLLLLVE